MCTIVFAPLKEGNVLASLRDESPARVTAHVPGLHREGEVTYVMPADPAGGGSWAGFNSYGTAIALMNGGFERHQSSPPYRMSRGLIVRKLLESKVPVVEWMLMPMEEIEPFTLIVFTDGQLFRLVWDGVQKHRALHDTGTCHIFSSSTLYNADARQMRKERFDNWMVMEPPLDRIALFNFFKSVKDPEDGFIMNRNEHVKTLSFSYMTLARESYTYYYYDLQKYTLNTLSLEQRPG